MSDSPLSNIASDTSILTVYLKSTGLFTPGVKFSAISVWPLQRYYNIQAHSNSNLHMENLSIFRECLSPDDIAKSHLQHSTL